MTSKMSSEKPVGVIGAGSFGTAIANILAEKSKVLLYARNEAAVRQIESERISSGQKLHKNISGTNALAEIATQCDILFPIVPSSNFRSLIKDLSEYLHPYHLLIHGTKGMDVSIPGDLDQVDKLNRDQVKTMSEIISDESVVVRVGCLAGPNLARELADM